jgi:hypothetical protein
VAAVQLILFEEEIMTRRDQYSFILHVLLPAIENEGLTIKTRRDGELTLSASGSVTTNFAQSAPALH